MPRHACTHAHLFNLEIIALYPCLTLPLSLSDSAYVCSGLWAIDLRARSGLGVDPLVRCCSSALGGNVEEALVAHPRIGLVGAKAEIEEDQTVA
jgi:hypothetical protein